MLGVCRRTIERWNDRGLLTIRKVGGRCLVPVSDLEKLVAANAPANDPLRAELRAEVALNELRKTHGF